MTTDKTILFVDRGQLTEGALGYLGDQVEVRPYNSFLGYLKNLTLSLELDNEWVSFIRQISFLIRLPSKQKILLGDRASLAVALAIGENKYTIERSPVNDLKAIKNETELEGFRQCHIRDGAALARYFAWLEEQLNNGLGPSESQAADQLEKYRS